MSLAVYQGAQQRQQLEHLQIVSIPAPTGGWNTRDALDGMDPRDAVILDNWIPEIGRVSARHGYEDFVADIAGDIGGTWVAGPVETLIPYVVGTNERLIAAMDGGLAKVNTGTAIEVKVRATYTSNRWQYTIFADSSAPNTPKVIAVNGVDTPWTYDDTTHANWAPTGPTAANLIWINGFKNRIFAGENGARDFWYGALGAIPGAMTRFPLSGIRGAQGHILFMAPMTRDTGAGPDDFAVFVTSEGQAIVYAGTNPGDAAAWALVGVYQIPRPIQSRRAWAQVFGDIVIATELDYIFLNAALQENGAVILDPTKLTGALMDAATNYRANYGWEMAISEADNLLLLNIPNATNAQYEQHVFNVQTRAGARFTGWNVNTWARWQGRLYAGATNKVLRMNNTLRDDNDGAASAIELRAQTAWANLGTPEIKHVKAVRPLIRSQGAFSFGAAIGTDFVDPPIVAVASTGNAGESTLWGDAVGVTTKWGDTVGVTTHWSGAVTASTTASREWHLLGGRGSHFCLRLATNLADQERRWLSTDYKVRLAGRF